MKKILSIIFLVIAVCGFFAGNILKDQHQVYEQRFNGTTTTPVEIALDPDAAHTVFIWAVDEETGFNWATVDAKVTLFGTDGTKLVSGLIQANGSDDKGGVKRAQNGFDEIVPPGISVALLSVELIQGDYVDVEIYADLPDWLHLTPGLSIIMAFIGLVTFLKSRK